jgi:hypothetical protein
MVRVIQKWVDIIWASDIWTSTGNSTLTVDSALGSPDISGNTMGSPLAFAADKPIGIRRSQLINPLLHQGVRW